MRLGWHSTPSSEAPPIFAPSGRGPPPPPRPPRRAPFRPMRHEIGVRDQDTWRIRMRAENSDRLAGLNEQRLVAFELAKRGNNAIKTLPIARRAANSAIHHKLARPLRNLRIEIV